MSNERTISVKSSVLEKALRDAGLVRFHTDSHVAELRALLDAPARTPLPGGGALEEQPEWAQIQILKNTVSDLQGDIEKLQADIAAQPQGEPVAWIDWSGGDCPVDADAMVEYSMAGNPQQVCRPEFACRLDWRHDHRPTKRKSNIVKYRPIAEQPAPVAVVLPESLPGDDGVCTESHYASGWNACLDELKRLNLSL